MKNYKETLIEEVLNRHGIFKKWTFDDKEIRQIKAAMREFENIINPLPEDIILNKQNVKRILVEDRNKILKYTRYKKWNVFQRKLNQYKFETALENVKLSLHFFKHYVDWIGCNYSNDFKGCLYRVNAILSNKKYSVTELLEIISIFDKYINWYHIYYNPRIPLEFKKENYEKIYADMLLSFDNSVPIETRIKNTKEELTFLKD